MMQHFGVIPVVVFDGARLPQKGNTEAERRVKRKENLEKAIAYQESGQHQAAKEFFTKAVDITPQMAYDLCQVSNVVLVVSNYIIT